jgi:hypothetical protein
LLKKQQENSAVAHQTGQSGNPVGPPKGARNTITLAMEALLDGEAKELTRKAIELAEGSDMVALRPCLDRITSSRGLPISIASLVGS